MSNIHLTLRYILELRRLFKDGNDLDYLKNNLREKIHEAFTEHTRIEDYYYDIDNIFLKIINMSLEDILYSCAAELFNKNVMVNVEYK